MGSPLSFIKRTDIYFEEAGPENTDAVIRTVGNRLEETGISKVIVASTSGETAVKTCEALGNKAKIIAISYKKMEEKNVERLKNLGAIIIEESGYPLSVKETRDIRNAYYTLGQGLKVAVEITLIAADKNYVKTGEEVIAIGGTDRGADTAIIVKASTTKEMLGPSTDKRLEIKEIIAMPRKKKWWE